MRITALIAVLVGMFGCEKQLPKPFNKTHIATLVEIADRSARLCDDLLAIPDCYDTHDGNTTPDAPSLPVPSRPFGVDAEFRGLVMGCYAKSDWARHCDSRLDGTEPLGWPIHCDWEQVWIRGNHDDRFHGDFEAVLMPTKPECAGPWGEAKVGRITPQGNFFNLLATFIAPEAERPGGPVHHLRTIQANWDHDARALCSDEGWETCFAPDVDPKKCLTLGLKSEGGKELMEALANQPEPPLRAKLAQPYLQKIDHTGACYFSQRLKEDSREPWRLKVDAANRRGPVSVDFSLTVHGALSDAAAHATVAPTLPALTKCFEDARYRLANGRVGHILIEVTAPPGGKPLSIEGGAMNNPKRDDALFPCVKNALQTLKLPRRASPSVISMFVTDMP
jgi:hypothetical protein